MSDSKTLHLLLKKLKIDKLSIEEIQGISDDVTNYYINRKKDLYNELNQKRDSLKLYHEKYKTIEFEEFEKIQSIFLCQKKVIPFFLLNGLNKKTREDAEDISLSVVSITRHINNYKSKSEFKNPEPRLFDFYSIALKFKGYKDAKKHNFDVEQKEVQLQEVKKQKSTVKSVIHNHYNIDSLLLEHKYNSRNDVEINTQSFVFNTYNNIITSKTLKPTLIEDIKLLMQPFNLGIKFEEVDISIITHALNISILHNWDEEKFNFLKTLILKNYYDKKEPSYINTTFYHREILGVVYTLLVTFKNPKLFTYIIKELSFFATNQQFVKELYKAIVDVFKVFGLSETNKKAFKLNILSDKKNPTQEQSHLSINEQNYISLKLKERLYVLFRVYEKVKPDDKYEELLKLELGVSFNDLSELLQKKDWYYFESEFDHAVEEFLSQLIFLDNHENITNTLEERTTYFDLEYFMASIHYYFPTNFFLEAEPNRVITTSVNISYYNPCIDIALKIAHKMEDFQFYLNYIENFPYERVNDEKTTQNTAPRIYGWKTLASHLWHDIDDETFNSIRKDKKFTEDLIYTDSLNLKYIKEYEEYFRFKENKYFYYELWEHMAKRPSNITNYARIKSVEFLERIILKIDDDEPKKFECLFWYLRFFYQDIKTFHEKTNPYLNYIKNNLEAKIQFFYGLYYKKSIVEAKKLLEEILLHPIESSKYKHLKMFLGHCELYFSNIEEAKSIYKDVRKSFDLYDDRGFYREFDQTFIIDLLNPNDNLNIESMKEELCRESGARY